MAGGESRSHGHHHAPPPPLAPPAYRSTTSPLPLPDFSMAHHQRDTFALAAFQSPEALDQLIHALDEFDTAQRVVHGPWNVFPGTEIPYQLFQPRGTRSARTVSSPPRLRKVTESDINDGQNHIRESSASGGSSTEKESGPGPKRLRMLPALGLGEDIKGGKELSVEKEEEKEDESWMEDDSWMEMEDSVADTKKTKKKPKRKKRRTKAAVTTMFEKEERGKEEEQEREKDQEEVDLVLKDDAVEETAEPLNVTVSTESVVSKGGLSGGKDEEEENIQDEIPAPISKGGESISCDEGEKGELAEGKEGDQIHSEEGTEERRTEGEADIILKTPIVASPTQSTPEVMIQPLPLLPSEAFTESSVFSPLRTSVSHPMPELVVQTGEATFDPGSTTQENVEEEDTVHEVKVRLPRRRASYGDLPSFATPSKGGIRNHGEGGLYKENIPSATKSLPEKPTPWDWEIIVPQTYITPATPDLVSVPVPRSPAAEDPTMVEPISPESLPDPVEIPIPPMVLEVDKSYPLAQSWVLYHSFSGSPALPSTTRPASLKLSEMTSTRKQATEAYSHGLFPLFTATTVEDLLGTWKALRRKIAYSKGRLIEAPSAPIRQNTEGLGIMFLPDDTNFHLFLHDVKPMWEDEMCSHGGKIMMAGPTITMDPLFLQVTLLLAGGAFEYECPPPQGSTSAVVGAVLSKRKVHTRIEIWLGARNQAPDPEWIRQVDRFLVRSFPGQKLFSYRGFKPPKA